MDSTAAKITALAVSVPLTVVALRKLYKALPDKDDQNLLSLLYIMRKYRNVDFTEFMSSHREALKKGQETGDYVPGVCNYYKVMADFITASSGPFWHFVPMTKGMNRKECHHKFHHTVSEYLGAEKGDKILEFGCGFGEIGRQVAKITGANVTGLTMADEEITGGTERIKLAGLDEQCRMVQGNYHEMPFGDNTFDRVFGVYTLKYSADLKKAIKEMSRVLKPKGKFLSYEILVTDKYDPENKQHRYHVDNISHSTCMPPLWKAQDMRDAAKEAGLVATQEIDLCSLPDEGQWYSCFTKTGIHAVIDSPLTMTVVKAAEWARILPKSFSDFFSYCCVHPATDFVIAGREGIISGAVMMVWEKA